MRLSSAFGPSILGIIIAGFLIGAASAILSKWKPQLGMIPLIGLGGIVALMILWNLIHTTPSGLERPLWPLVLANAGFLYLWWLSALLFDLVYIWHHFIRSRRTTMTLAKLRKNAGSNLRA
jgi:hypothetical protein